MYLLVGVPFLVGGCVAFYFYVLCPKDEQTADEDLEIELKQNNANLN